ncbi:MAG: ribonuclease J [Chloroflexi bacterium]|nr:ribonuclease J [Chloroflexota bacterium]
MPLQSLKWIPLGGLGEVGKNMMIYEYGKNILVVDCGLMFPESDMHGIDAVIPDYQYLKDKKDYIRGIIITHGHEDHTGAVPYLVKDFPGVPLYATPLTKGLLDVKLRRERLSDTTTINMVPTDAILNIGPFKVELFRMNHSIPDNVGMGVTTPAGLIVHSGDFKFDHTPIDGHKPDFTRLAEFAGRGVLALLSDSTNAEQPGITPSERAIDAAFENVFRDADGRVIIATFASLISRIQQIVNICEVYGRKLSFAGTSMVDNVKMAQKMGYLNIPDGMMVRLEDSIKMKPNEVAIMATGSQGEPSAVLARMATGKHSVINVQPGDTIVISAHSIPGNEEYVHRIINRLFQKGANVVYSPLAQVHVSGHASQEEQKLLLSLVRPKYFIPVHGELRMLKAHALLATDLGIPRENVFIVENGVPIEFTDGEAKRLERVPGGYVFVDGSGVGDIGPVVIRDREVLSRDGFILLVLRRDAQGKFSNDPEIITRGFVYMKGAESLIKAMTDTVSEALKSMNGASSESTVKDKATEALSKFVFSETRRRPMIIPVLA